MSDTASRISDLDSNFHELSDQLKLVFREFHQESRRSAKEHMSTQSTLASILDLLKSKDLHGSSSTPTDTANHPQSVDPGGASVSTGTGT